ncbi:RluA family pseudouridine synthase [Dehalobacterium formicoaceticum]|uniref:RluA family pseudouridine synthase n=1 Tax=Dehalobacterium formicoaceticum TaxID=51515 RepID=UPI000B7F763F|nr:RluA family pseudouridine synthase [Dehalobacterium formicoaceticum]
MKNTQLTYRAGTLDQNTLLRNILYEKLLLSHSLVVRLKQENRIKVNGVPARTNQPINPGDVITIDVEFTEENTIIPEPIPLEIIYEDQDFLVVHKPAGLSTHPSRKNGTGTLANAVAYYWRNRGQNTIFRPINRLDRDTSGLVLIGNNQFAHQAIFNPKKSPIFERHYLALVEGVLTEDQDCIDLPIAHPDINLRRRIVHPEGRKAVTHYRVLTRFPQHTLLALKLETGRTHQIRVHLSFLGHPLCGDLLYGSPSPLIDRQALHAYLLRFIHPRSGGEIRLELPLAADIKRAIDLIKNPDLHH